MDIFIIVIVAICVIIFASLLKNSNKEYAFLLIVLAVVLLLILILNNVFPVINELKGILAGTMVQDFYIDVLLKALGITIIGGVTASLCKDAGETALSNVVELASKIAIVIVSMPVIGDVLGYLSGILKN